MKKKVFVKTKDNKLLMKRDFVNCKAIIVIYEDFVVFLSNLMNIFTIFFSVAHILLYLQEFVFYLLSINVLFGAP